MIIDSVTIRLGVPEISRVQATALYCEALKEKLTPFLGPAERATRFLAPTLRSDRAFVALDDVKMLGIAGFRKDGVGLFEIAMASFWREYGVSGPMRALGIKVLEGRNTSDALIIDCIAVNAAARGRGIGTRLLGAICSHARKLGKANVQLDVIDTNPRAMSLYERRGFVTQKTVGIGPLRVIFPFRAVTTMRKPV